MTESDGHKPDDTREPRDERTPRIDSLASAAAALAEVYIAAEQPAAPNSENSLASGAAGDVSESAVAAVAPIPEATRPPVAEPVPIGTETLLTLPPSEPLPTPTTELEAAGDPNDDLVPLMAESALGDQDPPAEWVETAPVATAAETEDPSYYAHLFEESDQAATVADFKVFNSRGHRIDLPPAAAKGAAVVATPAEPVQSAEASVSCATPTQTAEEACHPEERSDEGSREADRLTIPRSLVADAPQDDNSAAIPTVAQDGAESIVVATEAEIPREEAPHPASPPSTGERGGAAALPDTSLVATAAVAASTAPLDEPEGLTFDVAPGQDVESVLAPSPIEVPTHTDEQVASAESAFEPEPEYAVVEASYVEAEAEAEPEIDEDEAELVGASTGGSAWTIPLLCAGIGLIACCLLIPLADANRRASYERQKLRTDLESLQRQVAVNDEFIRRVHQDPTLAERLAQRQMKTVRKGSSVLPLADGRTGKNAATEMSPFQLVAVTPPGPQPDYKPLGGTLATLCYQPRARLYLIGAGLFMMACGLVLGVSTPRTTD